MLKTLSLSLALSCSASAFAQNQSLEDLAQEVKQLVDGNTDRLDSNDQQLVRKNLRQIVNVFKLAGVEAGRSLSVICDSNNNQLINTDNGRMLHDFTQIEHCREALANVKVGKSFCDYNDNTLYQPNGNLVHDFSEPQNCKDAIASISRVKKYCDYNDNTLRKFDGSLIYDFSSKEECTKNL